MKKISHTTKPNIPVVPQHRSFRRFIRKMFTSILKRQVDGNENGFQKEVMQKLRRIEDLIAREMTGRTKRGK